MNKNKLTPRDKAILIGLYMGGGYADGPEGLLTSDYKWTLAWLETVLKGIRRKKEFTAFKRKLESIFFVDGVDYRYPAEYIDTLSPLAIAVWMATDSIGHSVRAWSNEEREKLIQSFQKRWSISLNHLLDPISEDDAINLWILTQQYLREFAPNLTPLFATKYPRNGKLIYLSGGQQFSPNGGANWRAIVSPTLYRAGYDVFNPVYESQAILDEFGGDLVGLKLDQYISAGVMFIQRDLKILKQSDAIITYIDDGALKGAGTKSEATMGTDLNIPNFFVLAEDIDLFQHSVWLAGCTRNKKFIFEHNDFKGAIVAIKRSI